MSKDCITLIGMPACGKSTVGVVLAKKTGRRFIDGDLVIQETTGKLLKELIEEYGDDGFRELEDRINAGLSAERAVIAPGGSIVYGENAMAHFRELGFIVYLKLPYPAVRRRLGNLKDRGVSIRSGQTLKQLYDERVRLYEKYADIVIDESGLGTRGVAEAIVKAIEGKEAEKKGRGGGRGAGRAAEKAGKNGAGAGRAAEKAGKNGRGAGRAAEKAGKNGRRGAGSGEEKEGRGGGREVKE